jgi:hypothetical protein
VVLPMPEVPPVTSATLPSNVLLLFIVFLSFVLFEKFQVISESCDLTIHPHKATDGV